MSTEAAKTTPITIDGVEYNAPLGGRLLDFLISIDKKIPHFCYHPGLPVDASCRQCQVESKGKGPRPGPVVSCRTSIMEGMEFETGSETALEARRAVMEFLLLNHPLDCPICDKAGECTLQDNAYETGQARGRTSEPRRRLDKRKSLGDKILLDNERCILCRRCVRFFSSITGEPQLTVTDCGDRSVLETFCDEALTGEYQGNIVDVCPVGALTLKKFRFQTRVWFLEQTKTICGLCSKGCNITAETRDHKLVRIRPRHTPEVNGYWMCDQGRLDFDYANLDPEAGRLVYPKAQEVDGSRREIEREDAYRQILELFRACSEQRLLLLSPFASLEEGEALLDFSRALQEAGYEHRLGFMKPENDGTADDLLRTGEPAPNVRGLEETLGMKGISSTELESGDELFAFGFGLERLCDGSKIHAQVWQSHSERSSASARLLLPCRTPFERSGYWVNSEGRKQYSRAALSMSSGIPCERTLFQALTKALTEEEATKEQAVSGATNVEAHA